MVHLFSFTKCLVLGMIFPFKQGYRFRSSLSMKLKKGTAGRDLRAMSPVYNPRGVNQQRYVELLDDPAVSILLGVGPAGTGKTLFACNAAVKSLKSGDVNKIIMTRPVVPVEEDIGFLPGDLITKMNPWTRPIFDILTEFYLQKDIDAMLQSGVIEISPLAFMRGRTFKCAFILADEMQNSSPNQMLMLTTRLGEGSKMVITGDLKQSDRSVDNGLAELMRKLKVYGDCDSIKMVEMENSDVERSDAVSKILDIYSFVSTPSSGVTSTVGQVIQDKPKSAVSSTTPDKPVSETKLSVSKGFDNDCALIPKHLVHKSDPLYR
jgi:phosphate starvation-inducible PhoH-like protein